MTYFITNRKHNIDNNNITISDNSDELYNFIENLDKETYLGLDTETTGTDPYKHKILLGILGNKDIQFVIDCTTEEGKEIFKSALSKHKKYIGHNLKFDGKMIWTNIDIEFGLDYSLYDTQIADQRLYQGLGISNKNPLGIKFNLKDVIKRHDKSKSIILDKETRNEFIGVNANNFIFQNRHIEYSAKDITYLEMIKESQEEMINKYNQKFLLYGIEFPLINILIETEIKGFIVSENKWLKNIIENKKLLLEKEIELDNEFRRLRDTLLNSKDRLFLTGGKYDRLRLQQTVQQLDIFGEIEEKQNENKGNINWGSSEQIIKILGLLKQYVPTINGLLSLPIIEKNKIVNKDLKFTTGETALQQYLIEKPNTKIKRFIELILDFREISTELDKYGENFLSNKNPVSNRFHTIFRQCTAVNGRFQSGGGKEEKDKFNCQNIPRKNKFRNCFVARPNHKILTVDYSGAELITICSHAQDFKLLELSKGDMHSHFVQSGFRKIFAYRAEQCINTFDFEEEDKNTELSKSFIVSKKQNPDYRQKGKNVNFGIIYGCHAKKAGKTMNISKEEGQIYINNMRNEIPKTFKYVDNCARFAYNNGYLLLNKRTNSRIWFPDVINYFKTGTEIPFFKKAEIENNARNYTISGTQADFIKEAMVEVYKYIKTNKIDAFILMQVHDELVIDFPEELEDFPTAIINIMKDTANKYLNNVKIDVEYHVEDYWLK